MGKRVCIGAAALCAAGLFAAGLVAAGLFAAVAASCVKGRTNDGAVSIYAHEPYTQPERAYTRVISTAPSNTEIIAALGLAGRLIAIDRFSGDVPGLPDDLVSIDFMNPDAETLISLEPDLIIANAINRQRAGSTALDAIAKLGVQVVYVPVSGSLESIESDIQYIARLLGVQEKGDAISGAMRRKVNAVREVGGSIAERRTVYFEVEPAPHAVSFGSGVFINEMIALAGARNIFAMENGFFVVNAEEIITANPDVILTNAGDQDDPVEELYNRTGFENINAHKTRRIYFINTNNSARAGPNVVKGLYEIARAIYPEYYSEAEFGDAAAGEDIL
jgi:iron complex transport system substrate-binding protein